MRTRDATAVCCSLVTCAIATGQPQVADVHVIYESTNAYEVVSAESGRIDPMPEPISLSVDQPFVENVNIHPLAPVSPTELAAAEAEFHARFGHVQPGPLRNGFVRRLENGPLTLPGPGAMQTKLNDGRTLWTLAIRSPGAFGIRVHFSGFDVGRASVVLYSYNEFGMIARGPFTARGLQGDSDFWSPSLPGDTVYIEAVGDASIGLAVAEIVHFDDDDLAAPCATFGVLSCHEDVNCHLAPVKNAVGRMSFISGGSSGGCTGTLLSDEDPDTTVPWFLTAFHCLSTQVEVDTLEVVWFFQTDSCGGTAPDSDTLPRNLGGTLFETNPSSSGNDMTFIRLNGGLPGGIGLVGWTTATGVDGYGVHHPCGSFKRWTAMSGVGICPECACVDSFEYDYYDMDEGMIQPGSSGSGIFRSSDHRLAGQLRGDCGPADDTLLCSTVDDFTAIYGEFEETYPLISQFLRVGGTMYVEWNAPFPWVGTADDPYPSVTLAHLAAWSDLQLKIRAGSYAENPTLNKRLTLRAEGGVVRIGTP